MSAQLNEIFGRIDETGNAIILYINDGDFVTSIDVDGLYPVGSQFGCHYCHARGIHLTIEQCKKLKIDVEDVDGSLLQYSH